MMKKFIRKHKYSLMMMIPGAIAGYLYWRYVGCNTGTCPITSIWYNSAIFGAILGYLAGSMGDDANAKKQSVKSETTENIQQ